MRERNESRDPAQEARSATRFGSRSSCRPGSRVSLRSPGGSNARISDASISPHDVKQRSVVRSRGACCARVLSFPFASIPLEGWAERRQAHLSCCRVCETRLIPRSVRRGASHDAGRSPLGAPPWRFWAGGRASFSGISSGSVQRAPRSQVVMPGGRCPGPPAYRSEAPGDNR